KEISFIKNSGVSFEEYQSSSAPKSMVLEAFKHYEAMKSKYRLIDFDDMLTKTKELLISDEKILSKWQNRFKYYLIDEAQDMNGIQYDIIRLLCVGEKNLFMVGDDDQSIYGFRGAKPSILLDFPRDFSGCETILLDHNYRCTKEIAEASLALIDNNAGRYKKDITFSEEKGMFEVLDSKSYAMEAELIAGDIVQKLKSGVDPKSIAVLYRHHQCARLIVEQFIERQIPFYLKDHMPNIYTHFVMEDMAAFLEIAGGNATRARMMRIINRPNRYILRQALEKDYSFKGLKCFYHDNPAMYKRICGLERDFLLLKQMTPYAAVNYVRKGMDYEGYLKKLAFEKGMDYSELISILDMFSSLVKDCKTTREAIEKLNFLKLEIDYKNRNSASDKTGVGLYTLHSSKGLEFDSVYICDVNEGVIPSKKANSTASVEEERRLFYVGLTRAKKELKLLYVTEKNRERLYPSRF
ncbi:MAG: ATP-dependent helicase, partial [Pseudobutyrivibrio sp.]|nr:ATP-dependent helicase [Pseudobutyrivibrio sp.]